MRASAANLIGDSTPRGVFDKTEPTKRRVFCTLRSVGYRERYEAMTHGLQPELVMVLSDYAEYKQERLVELEGVVYEVLRTYITDNYAIELTLQRSTSHAGSV